MSLSRVNVFANFLSLSVAIFVNFKAIEQYCPVELFVLCTQYGFNIGIGMCNQMVTSEIRK